MEALIEDYDKEQATSVAYHEAAHAVAHEVKLSGVESVTIEATADRRGETRPKNPDALTARSQDLLLCLLAGPAIDEQRGDEEVELEVESMISGDLEHVHRNDLLDARGAGSDEELREAWEEARAFVSTWHEVIEHVAGRLLSSWQLGELPVAGHQVREIVQEREAYGLEVA